MVLIQQNLVNVYLHSDDDGGGGKSDHLYEAALDRMLQMLR